MPLKLQKTERTDSMDRRIFLASAAAAALLAAMPAHAALSPDDAKKFIDGLSGDAIGSLTGATITQAERESRFRGLLEAHFDMPGISKFTLGRYWKLADEAQQAEFQKLFETLLVQSYAKTFAQYGGEKFQVTKSWADGDGTVVVNSHVDRPNGDVIHLDWRVADQADAMRVIDLVVEGVSLRDTHRSDFASAIQSNGGTIAALLDLLRQKVGGA
jgi:phospholipid transport system substrate-binding protein